VQIDCLVAFIKRNTATKSPRDSCRYANSLVLILHKDCTITIDVADAVLWACSQESTPAIVEPVINAPDAEAVNAPAPEPVLTPAQPARVDLGSDTDGYELPLSGSAS
jgi:hypothetical protein